MADRDGLLNRCTGKTVPGVRIPLPQPVFIKGLHQNLGRGCVQALPVEVNKLMLVLV